MENNNSIKSQYKYSDITAKIIGCSMEVHKVLGNGFTNILIFIFSCVCVCFAGQEVIYQRALAWEFIKRSLSYEREIEQHIYYRELTDPIGTRRADFVIEEKVLVELKAVIELQDVHYAQILNYLKAYKLPVGLLINFGSKSLTF